MILLEAITPTGSISADWVLVGMTGLIIIGAGWVISLLREALTELKNKNVEQDQELKIHEMKLIEHRGEIDHTRELLKHQNTQHSDALRQILDKMTLVKSKP
jgi:hypothetical protein